MHAHDANPHVVLVELARPKKLNAMDSVFWCVQLVTHSTAVRRKILANVDLSVHVVLARPREEFPRAVAAAAAFDDARVLVVCGEGRAFTAGLDVTDPELTGTVAAQAGGGGGEVDGGRTALKIRRQIKFMQLAMSCVAECPLPVIAAVHGACIGAGVDLITACDIRLASSDAKFSVREVRIGLAADVGTLQRLPKVVGNDSACRELAFTGQDFSAVSPHVCCVVGSRRLPLVFPSRSRSAGGGFARRRGPWRLGCSPVSWRGR